MTVSKSRHRLKAKQFLARGLRIQQTYASPYWYARVWDAKHGRYVVRSTKETSKLKAREVAWELLVELKDPGRAIPKEFSFRTYAQRAAGKARELAATGERNAAYARNFELFLSNVEWGLLHHFGGLDIRSIKRAEYQMFMSEVRKRRPDLSSSTLNSLTATFRNVLKVALDDGVIDSMPTTPRTRQKDNPRSFFRFAPLDGTDEYEIIKKAANQLAIDGAVVRGIPITKELYDIILFCVHSWVRPTTSELYALKHSDVTLVGGAQPHLVLRVRKGKTGPRRVITMAGAVPVFKRVKERNPEAGGEDYLFFPRYLNRDTAARVVQRQFNHLLEITGLKYDPATDTERTLYSLRHTAICMRIVKSKGRVNNFLLAKNAGTSEDQIERFYAKHLPLSGALIENLQAFGE